MKKILPFILPLLMLSCIKGKQDTTYTFTCSTACKTDSFTYVVTDTIFYNITDGQANLYVRNSSSARCTTTCQR